MNGNRTASKADSETSCGAGPVVDPQDAADQAGLHYVSDDIPGIRRLKHRGGFRYVDPAGRPVRDAETLERIKKLAIPPAYGDVWICSDEAGHIQATGRDAKGRKQYKYHQRFREVRDSSKYEHMLEFARTLPGIRKKVDEHLSLRGLPREKVLATIVRLLETTMIRVGNSDYARQNKSYGLTTLRDRHVEIDGSHLRFRFRGKSGKHWNLGIRDRRIARVVKACQDLPGQHLFQYIDEDGEQKDVSSGDINIYLKDISGSNITAKDFRTWTGTILAALALSEFEEFDSAAAANRNIRAAIEQVAARLGNTPTVCRKCYVHPEILNSYLANELVLSTRAEVERELRDEFAELSAEEAVVLAFLRNRLIKAPA